MLTGTRLHSSNLIQICLHHRSPVRACHTKRVIVDDFIESVPSECYTTLKVTSGSSIQEVKDAYIKLARKYHPDGDLESADAEQFAQLNAAYNTIMKKLHQQQQQQLPTIDDDYDDMKDKKITSPQHRQYLSYEGFGIGTMSQRERQYNKYRVLRAAEKVQEYRVEKMNYPQENAVVVKDKKSRRKLQISSTIERVVEDLIQDAMIKGEFHNLPGSGKPFSYTEHNPMLDISTHNLNKILINNGYTPEWIRMRKDIIKSLQNLHSNLSKCLIRNKGTDHAYAFDQFQIGIKDINEKIDKYNMVVPILSKQMVHYSYQKELQKVQRNPEEFLREVSTSQTLPNKSNNIKDAISWSQVWKDIKDVFR